MRMVLRVAALIAVVGLPAAASADDQMSHKPGAPAASAPTSPPASQGASQWYRDAPAAESCWGDSSEKDADLNDGGRITTEDILRLLNPARS